MKVIITKKKIREIAGLVEIATDPFQVDIVYRLLNKQSIFLSAMRQVGKTQTVVLYMVIAGMLGLKVLYTGHNSGIVKEVFTRVRAAGYILKSQGFVNEIRSSKVEYSVSFNSGGVNLFSVRSGEIAVGLTFDSIVWDEAQKVTMEHVESITPTLQTSEWAVEFYAGTPPTDDEWRLNPDGPFIEAKKRGGSDWVEYSSASEYSPDLPTDPETCRKANPSARRIKGFNKKMVEQRRKMSHESFCRQYLGVWNLRAGVEILVPEVHYKVFDKIWTKKGSDSNNFIASVGLNVDSSEVFISMNDGFVVEVARKFFVPRGELDEIVEWVRERVSMIHVLRIPGTARGKSLQSQLIAVKFPREKIELVSLPDGANYITRFLKQVRTSKIQIYRNDATEMALTSFRVGFDRRSSSSTIESTIPEEAARVMSIAYSVTDGNVLKNLHRIHKKVSVFVW